MVRIFTSSELLEAKRYVFQVVFSEFLGLNWELHEGNEKEICLEVDTMEGRQIKMPNIFFRKASEKWLSHLSLPKEPLKNIDIDDFEFFGDILVQNDLPLIFSSEQNSFLEKDDLGISLNLDILGSIFFMLTRYEEYVTTTRDTHDRFPAHSSLAYREHFLERPLADEYVEILWACLFSLNPKMVRKETKYSVEITCDVDRPFSTSNQSVTDFFRRTAADLVVRKSLTTALKRTASTFSRGQLSRKYDPNNTFDWYMSLAEKFGIKASFYFLTGGQTRFDGSYNITSPEIVELLKVIHKRGHQIGLHPSYETYKKSELFQQETGRLFSLLNKLGIKAENIGGRHHYLRWDPIDTWLHWESAQLSYDSSLGFADHIGFRCGTCKEYTVFSISENRTLNLHQRPLIVMDVSLLSKNYMNLTEENALVRVKLIALACRKVKGNLILLWHNDFVITRQQKRFFHEICKITSLA